MIRKTLIAAMALAVLSGCDSASEPPPPGAPTAGERRALDDAAEMIEDQRLPASAIPATQASEEAPADTQAPPPKPSG